MTTTNTIGTMLQQPADDAQPLPRGTLLAAVLAVAGFQLRRLFTLPRLAIAALGIPADTAQGAARGAPYPVSTTPTSAQAPKARASAATPSAARPDISTSNVTKKRIMTRRI